MSHVQQVFDSIIETVGNTPLVKLRTLSTEEVQIYAKVEFFNPGHSSKDRIALPMIEDAERKGILKPGGTIIEATSGNTGLALALTGIVKGYKVILVMPDKMSPQKIDLLKAMGCQVIVTPTEVEPDDPRSYYSIAQRLAEEIPNSFYAQQYWNENNASAHYKQTGPEIWKQTDGKITHFIAGVGTGGTISGTGRFLKEKNPDIKVIGVDPVGSILAHYHEHRNTDIQAHSYKVEGVGEDIIPTNVHFEVIDKFVKVNDAEAFEWTRKLAREEGLMVGGSSGLAVAGVSKLTDEFPAGSFVVVLLPDTGERYLTKIFNDAWMRRNGFLPPPKSIEEILNSKSPVLQNPIIVNWSASLSEVVEKFRKFESITQVIIKHNQLYFALDRRDVFKRFLMDMDDATHIRVNELPLKLVPKIDYRSSLAALKRKVVESGVVLVSKADEIIGVITLKDLVDNFPF